MSYTFFADHERLLYNGSDLVAGLAEARGAIDGGRAYAVSVFHDASGRVTEVDPRESESAFEERVRATFPGDAAGDVPGGASGADTVSDSTPGAAARSGPGRPKLGVVSREVSLLPRHWEWLNAQQGKASATLRRLVDEARRREAPQEAAARARDAAYRAMSQLAGDEPGYEEVSRALYSGRFVEVAAMTADWRPDVRDYLKRLVRAAAEASVRAAGAAESTVAARQGC